MPNSLSSEAMRRSVCMAIASPPPRQNPRIRAIVGLRNPENLFRPTLVIRPYSCCASAFDRSLSNWLISAPETNALLPAPVRITTRTELSSANSSRISPSPTHISTDMALRFSGWLNVTNPIPSSFAASILPPAYSTETPPLTIVSISDRSLLAHVRNLRVRIADRVQHFIRAGAGLRRRNTDVLGEARDIDRRGHHLRAAALRARHLPRHAQMFHLRIGKRLVDGVDRPAGNPRPLEQLDPVIGRLRPGDLADRGVDLLARLAAPALGLPFLLRQPVRPFNRLAEPGEHPRRARGDVDVAIAGREHAGGDTGRMIVAGLARHLAFHQPAAGLEVEHEDLRLQQRGRHPAANPGAFAVEDRHHAAQRQQVAGGQVVDRDADAHRPAARLAGDRHQPAHALRDLIDAGTMPVRPVLTEAADAAVDDPRVDRLHILVGHLEAVFHLGAHILQDH